MPVTTKGQVTIPVAIRRMLGVRPRDRVTFSVDNGEVKLLRQRMSLDDAFGAVTPRSRPENFERMRKEVRQRRLSDRARRLRP